MFAHIVYHLPLKTKVLLLQGLGSLVCLVVAVLAFASTSRVDDAYGDLVTRALPSNMLFARSQRLATEMVATGLQGVAGRVPLERSARAEEKAFAEATRLIDDLRSRRPDLSSETSRLERELGKLHGAVTYALRRANAGQTTSALASIDEAFVMLDELKAWAVPVNQKEIDAAQQVAAETGATVTAIGMSVVVGSILLILAGLAGGAFFVERAIAGPVNRLSATMRDLAAGDRDVRIEGLDRQDELGGMAAAVRSFKEAAIERERLAAEKEAADEAAAQERAAAAAARDAIEAEQKRVMDVLGRHLNELAGGDLTSEIADDVPEAFEGLKVNYNVALASLRRLIAAVAESAAQIQTGSSEIAQASEDLARRTEANAAGLEETAASITEMDGRLKSIAGAAAITAQKADQTLTTINNGRSVADDAVQAMSRVNESAKGIDSVIEGLDKIAFQTRVLAMNAAVEAGRAGEAGRGFAVVADLVSALAMRAEEEARSARNQLTATQHDIGEAVSCVERVDRALQEISTDVDEVHGLLETVAGENQAQAAAISLVTSSIDAMDKATQQNAAMVEETSAAARNLMNEVVALSEQANSFKVDRRLANRGSNPPSTSFGPAAIYRSPVKALPASAVAALKRPEQETSWNEF